MPLNCLVDVARLSHRAAIASLKWDSPIRGNSNGLRLGWSGAVSLRLRYAWERNSVTNWNTDTMQPYMYQTLNQSQVAFYQALAGNNPNYNVHMIGGTVAWAW